MNKLKIGMYVRYEGKIGKYKGYVWKDRIGSDE